MYYIGGHSIKYYVDIKMGEGQKMYVFVHTQGIKSVHEKRGGG